MATKSGLIIFVAIVNLCDAAFTVLLYHKNIDILMAVMVAVWAVGSLALLFGAIKKDKRLVLVAAIVYLVVAIYWVIVVLGICLDFGGFRDIDRSKTVTFLTINTSLALVAQALFTLVVFVYYSELHNSGDE